jgi:hypothetical protein
LTGKRIAGRDQDVTGRRIDLTDVEGQQSTLKRCYQNPRLTDLERRAVEAGRLPVDLNLNAPLERVILLIFENRAAVVACIDRAPVGGVDQDDPIVEGEQDLRWIANQALLSPTRVRRNRHA